MVVTVNNRNAYVSIYLTIFVFFYYKKEMKFHKYLIHSRLRRKWKKVKVTQSQPTLWTIPSWNSPGQNNGVGSCSLLQGIFPTQGWNTGLPHCRQILYQLSYLGSPRMLDWEAYPFSSGFSRPRNWTGVSFTAGGFFTSWATREASLDWEECT